MRTFVICMFAILLLGCSSYQQSSNPPAGQPPGGNQTLPNVNAVTISGFRFSPTDIKVTKGTNVTWTNEDNVMHTVTFDNGMFSSHSIQHGDSVSYVFNTPGVYTYHCSIHTTMTGSVTVK